MSVAFRRVALPVFLSSGLAVGLGFGCGGGAQSTTTGTFGTGGTTSSTHTGQGAEGGNLFPAAVNSSSSGGPSTSSSGTGGSKPVCDGNPTTGPVTWAMKNADDDAQYGLAVATDTAGNVLVTGSYSGSLTIGGKTAEVTNASKAIFVAQLGPDGTANWVHGYAVTAFSGLHPAPSGGGHGVATDSLGNVYVVGDMSGAVNFGGGHTVQSAGGQFGDIFLLKLDASGNTVDVKRIGDPDGTAQCCDSGAASRGIAVLKSSSGDRVAIVGDVEGTLQIESGKTFTGGGSPAAFLAVYKASDLSALFGALLGDGLTQQSAHAVTFDKNHDIIITGNAQGPINFPGGPMLTPTGAQAAFVAKLKGDGSGTTWAKLYGSGTAGGEGVAVDSSGDIFVTGDHQGDIDFGGGALANKYGSNVYVAKLDGAGSHVWSYTFGDSTSQHAHGIVVDATGRAVVAGQFSGNIDFGNGPLTSAGSDDIFVAKLDTHGCQVWAHAFGDPMLQTANGIALDASGNTFIGGNIQGAVSFGSTMVTAQGDDVYVTKIAP